MLAAKVAMLTVALACSIAVSARCLVTRQNVSPEMIFACCLAWAVFSALMGWLGGV